MRTGRVTMAQALVGFLKNQHVERDGTEAPFFAGIWGIFGHGIVAGLGQALQQNPDFRYYLCRNEQAGVHIATAYAKARNRLAAFACTSSIGPGATNMITGAATATINRLPVLLLPGDIFARRNVAPVLQQLESEHSQDVSVNDCFKLVSRYWDRINRPDQLPCALVEAMRVLTSPAQTGAVTLALPQDVQAEAWDYPAEMEHALAGYAVEEEYARFIVTWKEWWERETDRIHTLRHGPPVSQGEVIGAVNRAARPEDVVVCAAGSLPGDLHKLWRTRRPGGYHLEYGYSCMGYEIAGGLGVKMADPAREVYVMVGDGCSS